jgi:hypothetical protein
MRWVAQDSKCGGHCQGTLLLLAQVIGPCILICIARWKIGNIGNIVVNQQLSQKKSATIQQHIGNIIVNQQLGRQL